MTYNNTFPVGYQPYYPQYQQMNNQQNVQQVAQNNQVQNGGFVRVQNENEARNYLVALEVLNPRLYRSFINKL